MSSIRHECLIMIISYYSCFFFFNDTATTEIYTLSLHDALPISRRRPARGAGAAVDQISAGLIPAPSRSPVGSWAAADRPCPQVDRKSTRLNSSHANISYAVFCLKKKKKYNFPNIQSTILKRCTD